MKSIIKYIFVILLLSQKLIFSQGIWTELNPKVPRVDYYGIHFVNPDTGWAVGINGTIIKTEDGGETWNVKSYPTENELLRVESRKSIVLVVGLKGTILRSKDYGETWASINSGTVNDLWQVQMINDTLGWICGLQGTLLRTTNGGLTWEQYYNGELLNFWSLDFWNEEYGVISCNSGQILRTTDGGKNWKLIQPGDEMSLYTIEIINPSRLSTVGAYGQFYYSLDSGYTWQPSNQLIPVKIESISFANDSIGIGVTPSPNISFRTTDGGESWFIIRNVTGEMDVEFINDSTAFCVGRNLKVGVSRDRGASWQNLIWNDRLEDISFISDSIGYVISVNGVFRTADKGNNWEIIKGSPGGTAVYFMNKEVGFAGGLSDKLHKTTDSGNSWRMVDSNLVITKEITFLDSRIGWLLTSEEIKKTTDSGETWVRKFETRNIRNLYFLDTLNGWLVSEYVYKTTDGGVNWEVIPEIVGPDGFLFFPDSNHWLINGSQRYITTDGGNSWINITNDTPTGFNSFSAVTDVLGYAVGELGIILRYDDTTVVGIREENGKQRIGISEYELYQNYPNPFNPSTTIKFTIPKQGLVTLKIFNSLGQEIKTLINETKSAGECEISFDASGISSGVYFYRIHAGEFFQTKKLIITK